MDDHEHEGFVWCTFVEKHANKANFMPPPELKAQKNNEMEKLLKHPIITNRWLPPEKGAFFWLRSNNNINMDQLSEDDLPDGCCEGETIYGSLVSGSVQYYF